MYPILQGLWDNRSTSRTSLASSLGVNEDHIFASTFSLAFKILPEHPPGCIGYGKGQTMVPNHVGHLQIFNRNRLVAIYVVAGSFVKRILTLIGNMLVNACDLLLGDTR